MSSKSEYSDDIEISSGSDGNFSDAECVDEYSVDSDGNIKPDQNVKKLPKRNRWAKSHNRCEPTRI